MTSSDDFGLKKFTHNFVCKRPCVIDIAKRGWGGGGRKQGGSYTKKTYNKLIHEKNSIASFYYRCNIENVIGIILST